MVLFPDGLKALKKVAKKVGLNLKGAYVNLDGGFDSTANRASIMASATPTASVQGPSGSAPRKRGVRGLR